MKLILPLIFSVTILQAQIQKDKQLHFAAGTIASATGYTFMYEKTKNKKKAFLFGVATAIAAGTLKEIRDSRQINNRFDVEDLAATTLGGISIGVTINLFNNDKTNKKIRKRRLGLFMWKN